MVDFKGNILTEGDTVIYTKGSPSFQRGIFRGTNRAFARIEDSNFHFIVNVPPKQTMKD